MQQKRFLTLTLGLVGILALISLYSCNKSNTSPTVYTVTYDGFTYHAITIGGVTFTVENARNTCFSNGDTIRNAQKSAEWKDSTNTKIAAKTSDTGAWCYYNNTNNLDTQKIYGKLYNWYAVKDARGLAPKGYHVATTADFNRLISNLGATDAVGQKLKSAHHWTNDGDSSKLNRDKYGFAALPAGLRYKEGNFNNLGIYGCFWSSTESSGINASYYYLTYNDSNVYKVDDSKLLGFSVRFVRD